MKFKRPEWKWDLKLPEFLKPSPSVYGGWKKFVRQIPPESRSILKSYQHFIVLGMQKSGKTELIQSLIDQSQDLYPFDTTYTEMPEAQFYIGPRQVIEEISFPTLENRSIKGRKQIIRLWKRLFSKTSPLVVVAYDCGLEPTGDLKEQNKLAQLIAGKASLLAEISKKPIKLRVALTHLDKVPGYLEFARFLKQQNLTFTIPLSSDFETNHLATHLQSFAEEHLTLILTSVSHTDYTKILQFFKQMPYLFSAVEEFLRAIVSRVSLKNSIDLDKLCLTSNQESSSSSSVFQWAQTTSIPLFFRYPLLRHQITAGLLYTGIATLLIHSYLNVRNELIYVKKGIESLDLLQFPSFYNQIANHREPIKSQPHLLSSVYPYFFTNQLDTAKDQLAHRIRKHIIEPSFRKTILENKGEFKYLYFLGLMQSTADNHMGKFVYKNAGDWSKVLGIDEKLIKTYVTCSLKPLPATLLTESKVSPFLPLTSLDPWFSYLKKIKHITDQPIFIEQSTEEREINKETERLLVAVSRLRGDPLIFAIATLLDEAGFKENENIKTVHWVGENIDALENFLLFIMHTYIPTPNIQGMNITQFFAKIKEVTLLSASENELYNFTLNGQLFSFDSKKWTDHIITHNIEESLQEYMSANSDSNGAIFFSHTHEPPEPTVAHFQELFPVFKTQVVIPGRYSRGDFEKKVRSPAEKLASFIDSLPINIEEKKRFSNFLTRETINYIQNYQSKYITFFQAYDFEIDSIKGAKKLLKELSKPTASFYDFLRTVQHQTNVFAQPILSMKTTEGLHEFAFLDSLLQHKDDQIPITEYQKLMGQILEELENPPLNPLVPTRLAPHLTPVAQFSLNIFQNRPDSHLLKMQECLNQIGIPERYQPSFTKPLILVYKLGLQELKSGIESLWEAEYHPKIETVLSKFPFNSKETTVATFEEVEELLNPTSKFQQELKEIAALLSIQKGAFWAPAQENLVSLDKKIYRELNHASYIAHLLWDQEGKPKPLTIRICSIPFTTKIPHSVPSLSYIIAGGESMYNFNQDPSWQTFSIDWWKPESSYIGMELLNKTRSTKYYRNLQGPSSLWSFFTLLQRGEKEDANIWKWNLPGKNDTDTPTVSFRFEKNPEELFQPSEIL